MPVLPLSRWIRENLLTPLAFHISSPRPGQDESPAFSVADALRSPKRILVIPDSRPGGIFIGASKFWAIRRQYPEATMDLLAHKKKEYIAREIPFLDDVILYDDFVLPIGLKRRDVVETLKSRNYDIAFCFSSDDSFCPAYFCYKSGASIRVGFQRNEFAFFNIRIVPRSDAAYEPDRLSLLLKILGIPEAKEGISWSVSDEGAKRIRDRYLVGGTEDTPYVGLDISSSPGERPSSKHFLGIAKAVAGTDARLLIFFNYEERKEANQIKESLGPKALMFQNEDLPRTVALVDACDEVVACNTDILHLSVAMGRPVTGIFPADQKARWAPRERDGIRILDVEDLKPKGAGEITALFSKFLSESQHHRSGKA